MLQLIDAALDTTRAATERAIAATAEVERLVDLAEGRFHDPKAAINIKDVAKAGEKAWEKARWDDRRKSMCDSCRLTLRTRYVLSPSCSSALPASRAFQPWRRRHLPLDGPAPLTRRVGLRAICSEGGRRPKT